ncbi:ankyrin repeat-containing domain protein [Limtongia smithiae]|uniref:ankyrin repeat-containing domain protein n=1 Tax=Limtongia smithiae TaxID=1125753 RepID=UPI0034CED291
MFKLGRHHKHKKDDEAVAASSSPAPSGAAASATSRFLHHGSALPPSPAVPPPPPSRGIATPVPAPVSAAPATPPAPPPSRVTPALPPVPAAVPPPPRAPVSAAASSLSLSDGTDGANAKEQLIEACRRNNVDLLQIVLGIADGGDGVPAPYAAELINTASDALGNTALHVAALNGSYECLDMLLDIDGVEVDPKNRMEGNTPLHCAALYAEHEPEHAISIVDMLVDAGADPTLRNKLKDKPIDLVPSTNRGLRSALQGAELAARMSSRAQLAEVSGEEVEDEGSASE